MSSLLQCLKHDSGCGGHEFILVSDLTEKDTWFVTVLCIGCGMDVMRLGEFIE